MTGAGWRAGRGRGRQRGRERGKEGETEGDRDRETMMRQTEAEVVAGGRREAPTASGRSAFLRRTPLLDTPAGHPPRRRPRPTSSGLSEGKGLRRSSCRSCQTCRLAPAPHSSPGPSRSSQGPGGQPLPHLHNRPSAPQPDLQLIQSFGSRLVAPSFSPQQLAITPQTRAQ